MTPNESNIRRVSSSSTSSSSGSSRVSSASRSLGRSSLRTLLASTSQQPINVALEGVSKRSRGSHRKKRGLSKSTGKRSLDFWLIQISTRVLTNNVSPNKRHPSPADTEGILDRKSLIERDIAQDYATPPGVSVNILPTRRKSISPQHAPLPIISPSTTHVIHQSMSLTPALVSSQQKTTPCANRCTPSPFSRPINRCTHRTSQHSTNGPPLIPCSPQHPPTSQNRGLYPTPLLNPLNRREKQLCWLSVCCDSS